MKIKHLTKSDYESFMKLRFYAFPYAVPAEREEDLNKVWNHTIALGAFSDNEVLQSALMIHTFQAFLHGETVGMGGIGGIASYPEVRGQGNVRQLMEESLKIMKEKQMVLSYLAPFSYSFYRKFGYELAFEKKAYRFKPTDFRKLHTDNRIVKRMNWNEAKGHLQAIYFDKYFQTVGPVNREEWVWEEKSSWIEKRHIALCMNEENEAEGYMLYHFETEGTPVFVVDEMAALTGPAEEALWRFVSSHGAQFEEIGYQSASSIHLSHLLKEASVEQKVISGMMARIVDMKEFLKKYPFQPNLVEPIYLQVKEDQSAPWNNGVYKLEMNKNSIQVQETKGTLPPSVSTLSATIQTWTQLFLGTRTVKELVFQQSLQGENEDVQALASMLQPGIPELYDYF